MSNKVLVVGAAHMDILATKTGDGPGVDIPGEIDFEFGGCGANASIAMASRGSDVRLLTVLKKGGISRLIARNLEENKVRVIADIRDDISQGGFCSIIEKGAMASAVTSTPVERHVFRKDRIEEAMKDVQAVLLDGNLNRETLLDVSRKAFETGIPVHFLAVSEAKALRAMDVIGLSVLFMNEQEMRVIARELAVEAGDMEAVARRIHEKIGASMVVGLGENGVLAVDEFGSVRRIAVDVPDSVENTLGAGDALAGGVLARMMEGSGLFEAIRETLDDEVRRVLDKKSCHIGSEQGMGDMVENFFTKATMDNLTGAENRGTVTENLRRAMEKYRESQFDLSILYCDVNKFKRINDELGHKEGDRALLHVTSILKECIRQEDDHVGRMGGDEFMVILSGCGEKDAAEVVGRISEKTKGVDLWQGIPLGISAGAVTWDKRESLEALIERADKRMYEIKRASKAQMGR